MLQVGFDRRESHDLVLFSDDALELYDRIDCLIESATDLDRVF
ncbi:hypothetical protein RPHASCH2410_CH10885 [Rhizobium phaseoli Ch24-10]|nr:hypothetical protein RPHASCH2410_CH10885 [Rhizobium phaseoli Ch24-10]